MGKMRKEEAIKWKIGRGGPVERIKEEWSSETRKLRQENAIRKQREDSKRQEAEWGAAQDSKNLNLTSSH